METFLAGVGDAFRPDVLAAVLAGVLLGYIIGVLPGLNRPAALAIAIPLSYYMSPVSAIGFLIGIAKASGAGGATSAIILNIPGEPNAVVTCLDGYPMARAGKAEKALKVALYSSVIGDVLATLALIIAARPLATAALHFGPLEMTGIMLISLTFIAGLSSGSVLKGMAAGILGVFVSTIGIDAETATPRLTFGQVELMDGIPLLVVTVGMLALSEMFIQVESHVADKNRAVESPQSLPSHDRGLSLKELGGLMPTIGRSSAIGIGIGLLPGLGPTIASFASYAYAKRTALPTDRFGAGEPKGVAAAETADNAVVPASLIPLFALGIPGSVSAAILVGAFTIHGVTPGPRMFDTHARLVYGVYGAMLIASILLLLVGRFGLIAFAKLARVPATIIIPVVIMLCIAGAYIESRSLLSVQLMIGFAILAYAMHRFGYSRITFLIGFIVGPLFELSLRQSLILLHGSPTALFNYPLAIALMLAAVMALVLFIGWPQRVENT